MAAKNGNTNTNTSDSTTNTSGSNSAGASSVEGATVSNYGTAGSGNAKTNAGSKDARAAAEETKKQIKKLSVGDSLVVVGPSDPASGSQVFRFSRLNNKKDPLDLMAGQTLKVGGNDGDVTKEEAEILLRNEQWKFERK